MERSDNSDNAKLKRIVAAGALGAFVVTAGLVVFGVAREVQQPDTTTQPVGETVMSPAQPLEEEATIGVLDVAVISGLAVTLVYSIGRITNGGDTDHNYDHFTNQALDTLLDNKDVKNRIDDIVETNKLNNRFMDIVKDVDF